MKTAEDILKLLDGQPVKETVGALSQALLIVLCTVEMQKEDVETYFDHIMSLYEEAMERVALAGESDD